MGFAPALSGSPCLASLVCNSLLKEYRNAPLTMADFKNNPFKSALKGVKPKKKPEPAVKPAPPPPEMPEVDDDTLFSRAMSGVAPIRDSGRDVHKPAPPAPPVVEAPADDVTGELKRLLNGELEFDLSHSDEYVRGAVRGLDSRNMQKLAAGSFSVEAHLDLHGMNLDQAQDSLLFFVRECYLQGKRCVLVVTGRGLGSPGGQAVLKTAVQDWLTRVPLKRVVLAFATAQPRDGGAGAMYVLLRKRKKIPGEGKVAWEKQLFGF